MVRVGGDFNRVQMPSRVLLVGTTSMIGWGIFRFRPKELSVYGFCNPYRRQLPLECAPIDLEDRHATQALFDSLRPDLVIHCAAVCRVAKCETDPAFARRANVKTTENILSAISAPTRLVYCSSDHVFFRRLGPLLRRLPTRSDYRVRQNSRRRGANRLDASKRPRRSDGTQHRPILR